MKRTLTLIATLSLAALLLTACGRNTNTPDSVATPQSTSVAISMPQSEAAPQSDAASYQTSALLPNICFLDDGIFVDMPNYQRIEQGYTKLYIVHDLKYVAATVEKHAEVTTLEEAHEAAFRKFVRNVDTDSNINELIIESDSVETINGIEVYKYEGRINVGHFNVYETFITGYSFIFNGLPVNISGALDCEEQDEEAIAELKEIVEAMLYTVRSEE